MKAIDKMVRFLEIFDQDVICAGGNSRGGFAEIMAEARRLAAEEKAGDEGLREAEQKAPAAAMGDRKWHDLKVISPHWESLQLNLKNFEVRKNDRGFKVGDGLCLRHWEDGEYVVNEAPQYFIVEYVTSFPDGIKDGYVVMGLSRHAKVEEPKDCGFTIATCPYERCAGITKRADKAEEPLAGLAGRKGVSIEVTPPSFYEKKGEGWEIGVAVPWEGMLYPFDSPTYAECEAKAREFLAGLPDKGEK